MKLLFSALVALALLGADCQPGPPEPPPEPNDYCATAVVQPEPTAYESAVDYVSSKLATIIGGEPSTDRRATALVLIGSSRYCSGTVVGKRTVLTAGHCEGPEMSVRIGAQTFAAAGIHPHPNYSGNWPYNDLMLLTFEQDLPGPYVGMFYEAGTEGCTELLAQGWGEDNLPGPIQLNESRYSVVKEDAMVLYTKQIKPGGICFGDSGGPLYAVVDGELQLAGVTSTTYTQDCLVGGDHVNLRFYKPWLEANIQ